jgi:CheY-like chemotaxis protein
LLLVEDDRSVGDVVARALRSVARSVVWVTSAEEALVELERGMADAPGTAAAITMIVSDIDLPGADGVSFAARCRARGYAGPLLLISGDPSREPSPAQLTELRAQFLAKPFTQAQLGDGLDAAVAAAALSSAAAPPQPA